jgi:hypothetical protein
MSTDIQSTMLLMYETPLANFPHSNVFGFYFSNEGKALAKYETARNYYRAHYGTK